MTLLHTLRLHLSPTTALVRRHMPAGVELCGRRSFRRGFSLTATRDGRKASLFIRNGQRVSHKAAADGLMHWIAG